MAITARYICADWFTYSKAAPSIQKQMKKPACNWDQAKSKFGPDESGLRPRCPECGGNLRTYKFET